MTTAEQATWKSIFWLGFSTLATVGFVCLGFVSGKTASGQFGLLEIVSVLGLVTSMIGANLALCGVIIVALRILRALLESNTDVVAITASRQSGNSEILGVEDITSSVP
jgi:multisubunit Na+/H+ antiporter MnhE subunit